MMEKWECHVWERRLSSVKSKSSFIHNLPYPLLFSRPFFIICPSAPSLLSCPDTCMQKCWLRSLLLSFSRKKIIISAHNYISISCDRQNVQRVKVIRQREWTSHVSPFLIFVAFLCRIENFPPCCIFASFFTQIKDLVSRKVLLGCRDVVAIFFSLPLSFKLSMFASVCVFVSSASLSEKAKRLTN